MHISNNKGLVLFITFIFLMLISMGAVLVLLGVTKYTSVTEAQIQRLEAITLAEAGIHYAYWKMRTDPAFHPAFPASTSVTIQPALPDDPTNVEITVEETSLDSGRYKIQSKVTY